MKTTKSFMQELDTFPSLLDSQHLITLGLYKHKNIAYKARLRGDGPNYIKVGGRVLYAKEDVREFLLKRFRDGSLPMEAKSTSMTNK